VSETTASTTETADPEASRIKSLDEQDQRIGRLEQGIEKILDVLGKGEGKAHEHAEQHTEDRLDRPSTIAEQIREQLAEAKAREAADAEKRGHAERLAAVEQRVTDMAEKTPEAPQRRIEKILGWR